MESCEKARAGAVTGEQMAEVVIIGVFLTFRRPEELSLLLVRLDAQAAAGGENVTIVVVDTNPSLFRPASS